MNSINMYDYVAYFPTSLDESVRIEHCKKDKRKFYLTRKHNGVVGFCHHCGGSGFLSEQSALPLDGEVFVKPKRKGEWKPEQYQEFHAVPFQKLSKEIRVWWFEAGLNVSEYNNLGARTNNSYSVSLPLRRAPGALTGMATRNFKQGYPKWMLSGSKIVCPFTQSENPAGLLVITEDYLSSLRCSRHCYALPLMGTNMSTDNYRHILEWYDVPRETSRVVVWLDNDSPSVIQQAKDIQKRLANTMKCGIILLTREAKHYRNDRDLVDVLKL